MKSRRSGRSCDASAAEWRPGVRCAMPWRPDTEHPAIRQGHALRIDEAPAAARHVPVYGEDVADVDVVRAQTTTRQGDRTSAFESPGTDLTVLAGCLQDKSRMRVDPVGLREPSGNPDRLPEVIRRDEGVMRLHDRRSAGRDQQDPEANARTPAISCHRCAAIHRVTWGEFAVTRERHGPAGRPPHSAPPAAPVRCCSFACAPLPRRHCSRYCVQPCSVRRLPGRCAPRCHARPAQGPQDPRHCAADPPRLLSGVTVSDAPCPGVPTLNTRPSGKVMRCASTRRLPLRAANPSMVRTSPTWTSSVRRPRRARVTGLPPSKVQVLT